MLTVKGLRSRPKEGESGNPGEPDRWESDGAVRGSGALWVRVTPTAVFCYFRYSHAGKKKFLPLGLYDEQGIAGLTLAAAREKAGEVSKVYQSGVTDLHGHYKREREAAEQAHRATEEAARRAAEEAHRGTLKQLLDAYVGHLEQQGKQSAKDVRSLFKLHVTEAHPLLVGRRAAELTVDHLVPVIGALVDAGKGRAAGKLRSYMRAAYELAIASKTDPSAPMTLRAFGIGANPVASIGALAKYNRARDRVLTASELGAYLRRLDALPAGSQRDGLLLSLYLGGQRPTQLLRAKVSDVDLDAAIITLYDGKGRRQQARRHVLPLTKGALEIVERLTDGLPADAPVFSTTPVGSDKRPAMRIETLSVLVTEIAGNMVKADPPEAREAFQLRDIRRTCETMLASLKISSDVRAQLQSHGLGGVQQRHYDKHSYSLEKQQALKKWAAHLAKLKAEEVAKVVNIKKARS